MPHPEGGVENRHDVCGDGDVVRRTQDRLDLQDGEIAVLGDAARARSRCRSRSGDLEDEEFLRASFAGIATVAVDLILF